MDVLARCPNGHPVEAVTMTACEADGCMAYVAYEVTAHGLALDRQLQGAVKALEAIRREGKVCDRYETCEHRACQSSYAAWAIADAYLGGQYDGAVGTLDPYRVDTVLSVLRGALTALQEGHTAMTAGGIEATILLLGGRVE